MPEDRKLASRSNKLWTTEDDWAVLGVFGVVSHAIVMSMAVGLKPFGYFLSAVMFSGFWSNTILDDVRRSCFWQTQVSVPIVGFDTIESP